MLENSARSWYDAGWVDVRHRFSHGLTFLTNVTWAKSITNAPDFRSPMDESAIPQNDSDLDAEKGLACDVRLRYVATFVYNIPGLKQQGWMSRLTSHWELATAYQAQTGMPFTISVFGDTANSGTTVGENPIRANYTGPAGVPVRHPHVGGVVQYRRLCCTSALYLWQRGAQYRGGPGNAKCGCCLVA